MKALRKYLDTEKTKKNCGNCFNYTNASNYWESFRIQKEMR